MFVFVSNTYVDICLFSIYLYLKLLLILVCQCRVVFGVYVFYRCLLFFIKKKFVLSAYSMSHFKLSIVKFCE